MAYEDYDAGEMILRDELALDRTRLANERTLLAYARTAIMLFVTGGTLLKLFGETVVNEITAWAIIAIGSAVAGVGLARFLRVRQSLSRLRDR